MKIISDKERVSDWKDFCVTKGWLTADDMDARINVNKLEYTGAGSILTPKSLVLKVKSEEQAVDIIARASNGKVAGIVLSVYTGNLIFESTKIETAFWKAAMDKEIPLDFIPFYIRDILQIAY